jgi:hypothetical protein
MGVVFVGNWIFIDVNWSAKLADNIRNDLKICLLLSTGDILPTINTKNYEFILTKL